MGLGEKSRASNKFDTLFGKGVLAGKSQLVTQIAEDAGVDPTLFAAIIAHETGYGTSNAIQNYNNPAGIMDPKTKWTKLKKFDSLESGLEYSAKNLRRRIDQVGGDFEKLGRVYAPLGAENDPTNLNANWSSGVSKIYNSLGATEIPLENFSSENTQLVR